ncbi:endopolygalacturonase [Paenibacillus sp. FSL R7-0273]|nr:endopolygalacturonase [Paenibacillus sp. FSL R7-0273]OMF84405.1 endopolygalacturonase [Paenibacillus sp. FSL R7-0273]
MKQQVYNIADYGALRDSGTAATEAIAAAVAAANRAGGGTVYVPAGTFHTGAVRLSSNIELHLSPGSVLSFSTDPADYPAVEARWEGVGRQVHSPCIYAEDAVNVSITGSGTLQGNGAPWWYKHREKPEELAYPRPTLIGLNRCSRITVKDVTLLNSPSWTVNPIVCSNVTIDNVYILNPADSPNTDGINPESCSGVRISNCHIDVGDDCIAIKAGTEDTAERIPCENISITNCTMVHGHGAVVLGSEMSGDIRNVTISNCVFKETDRGIRMKSRRGRGGTIEDIRVSNIVMDGVICPFTMNLYYFCGPRGKEKYVWDKQPYPVTAETPCFRRIHFANITARNVHAAAGFLYGLAEQYVSDISFTDVDISMAEDAVPGQPDMMAGLADMSRRGFFLGNVRDVRFQQVTVENHEGPAFYIENGEDVEVLNCRSRNTAKPEKLVEQVEAVQAEA